MITAPRFRPIVILALAGWTAIGPSVAEPQDSAEVARKVITRSVPQYPVIAKRMSISGSVRLDVVVAPNGRVKSVEVKGGHPMLAATAQDAVRGWKYEAGPRETHETVEVKFNLQQ
jgi:TonB family protein